MSPDTNYLEVGQHQVQVVSVDMQESRRVPGTFYVIVKVRLLHDNTTWQVVYRESMTGGLLSMLKAILPHVRQGDEHMWWDLLYDSVLGQGVVGRILRVEVKEVRTRTNATYLATKWSTI